MAFIRHRGKTYSVVYKILDENGEEHTTSETFATQKEADKRKKEIEYKKSIGKFEVPQCTTVKELIEEYVQIYGHDKWGVSTYSGNVALINNYILPTIGDTKLASINTHFMENRKTVKHWFQEWNTRGKVVVWEIKQFFHKENQTIVEWYFKNGMNNGDIEEFDGISLIEWTEDNKIKSLKEFGCNRNTYNPYQESDTPQFRNQKANWF